MQHYTTLYKAIRYYTMLFIQDYIRHYTTLYNVIQDYITIYKGYTTLNNTIQRYTKLYNTIYKAIRHYTALVHICADSLLFSIGFYLGKNLKARGGI
jgi:hypothetical protein